jgi:N-acetylmuramic acid 6-phosphate etherase
MDCRQPETERASSASTGIDTWDDVRILNALLGGQERAIAAVKRAIPAIATAAAAVAERISDGGSLIYAGAGASIRIAVQDGVELPGTFGLPEEKIAYLIAGGRDAMFETLAGAEDDGPGGARDAAICTARDALIAVAASGTTPYTVAAANTAKERGALVVGIVNNAASPLGALAAVEILLESGPEVIAGSTRMGAGTAQKAALNLLSTLVNIKLGAIHDGMMVNVETGNAKLRRRAREMIMRITGANEARAEAALAAAGGAVKPAVLICAGVASADAARAALNDTKGNLRLALARLALPV